MSDTIESTEKKPSLLARPWVRSIAAAVIIFSALAAFLFWYESRTKVAIEDSVLTAPVATIAPSTGGPLNALYVKEGDRVPANAPIAQVGTETLFAKEGGLIAGDALAIGTYFMPGQNVVSVVDDARMRVVGTLEETKGLSRLAAGDRVVFTVDAFPGKKYEGVVDEVAPVSSDAGIAFSISDKRPTKKFDVYTRFDAATYPELKSGMSAKMTVYVK